MTYLLQYRKVLEPMYKDWSTIISRDDDSDLDYLMKRAHAYKEQYEGKGYTFRIIKRIRVSEELLRL